MSDTNGPDRRPDEESASARAERHARLEFTHEEFKERFGIDVSRDDETGDEVLRRMSKGIFSDDREAALWLPLVQQVTGEFPQNIHMTGGPMRPRNRAERRAARRR